MKEYRIIEKTWSIAIVDMYNTYQSIGLGIQMAQIVSRLNQIVHIGCSEIERYDLRYIDMLYPYLPTHEQKGLKEYLKDTFDLADAE